MAAPQYNAGGFNMPPPQNGQQPGMYPDINQQHGAQQMQPLMAQGFLTTDYKTKSHVIKSTFIISFCFCSLSLTCT